jgi:hypothetical protein
MHLPPPEFDDLYAELTSLAEENSSAPEHYKKARALYPSELSVLVAEISRLKAKAEAMDLLRDSLRQTQFGDRLTTVTRWAADCSKKGLLK